MKTIKVSEATPLQLNWLVAKCLGTSILRCGAGPSTYLAYTPKRSAYKRWEPTRNWKQGGPIIELEGITLRCGLHGWDAELEEFDAISHGPTALIAAMRCYVSSKLGDEVEIPEELK